MGSHYFRGSDATLPHNTLCKGPCKGTMLIPHLESPPQRLPLAHASQAPLAAFPHTKTSHRDVILFPSALFVTCFPASPPLFPSPISLLQGSVLGYAPSDRSAGTVPGADRYIHSWRPEPKEGLWSGMLKRGGCLHYRVMKPGAGEAWS